MWTMKHQKNIYSFTQNQIEKHKSYLFISSSSVSHRAQVNLVQDNATLNTVRGANSSIQQRSQEDDTKSSDGEEEQLIVRLRHVNLQ